MLTTRIIPVLACLRAAQPRLVPDTAACPEVGCDFLGPAARYTGRYAIVMAGHVRVAHAMVQRLLPIIERNFSTGVRLDIYVHVWYNASSLCEWPTVLSKRWVAAAT